MNTLYGVGVGPGDPELLTLRAVSVLRGVSAVVGPRPRQGEDSLAFRIAGPHVPASARREELVFPMTRDRASLHEAWESAARRVLELLDGGDVAFLTLGDASLYSTWTYLRAAVASLDPSAKTETIPGITSFAASAALCARPLAEGDQALLVVPWAAGGARPWLRDALAAGASAAFMKVADGLPGVDSLLRSVDRTDSVMVSRATLPGQAVEPDWQEDPASGTGYLSVVLSQGGAP